MLNDIEVGSIDDMTAFFYEARRLFITDAPAMWLTNFFINSILVRAHQINKGFLSLTNDGNFLCAAPLVRIQLETLLRLYEGLVVDSDRYINNFMQGKSLEGFSHNNKQLTYGYLCELLGKDIGFTGLNKLYQMGNKYLHPSEYTFKAATQSEGRNITLHNLESKLVDDAEMEELKAQMFYVNLAYMPVLNDYYYWFQKNCELAAQTTEKPTTIDPEKLKKSNEKIEKLLEQTKKSQSSD